jgi:hypothetical protein
MATVSLSRVDASSPLETAFLIEIGRIQGKSPAVLRAPAASPGHNVVGQNS